MPHFGLKIADERRLFRATLRRSRPETLNWAITILIDWRNEEQAANLIRIHGDNDLVLPLPRPASALHQIPGGQFNIVSRAAAIAGILELGITAVECTLALGHKKSE